MTDCLFCKIAQGQIPVKKLAEDAVAMAFPDLNPQAPTHALIIPKKHLASLAEVGPEDWPLVGALHAMAVKVAGSQGLGNGYRVVTNTGADSGQTVFHLHLHLLGGRALGWPPG